MTAPSPRRVFVTVGTDHHRFGRLMDWVQHQQDRGTAAFVVQHGSSPPVEGAVNHGLLPHADLLAQMADADVVVGQGGPGTVMDARQVGRRPLVVPRLSGLAEAVDDHQVSFCREMELLGHAVVASDEDGFARALRCALDDPASMRAEPGASEVEATVARIAAAVDALLAAPPPPRGLARLRQLVQRRSRPSSA